MKSKLVKTTFVLSVVLNLILLCLMLPTLSIGGGVHVKSPDGRFVASATSMQNNNFSASQPVIGIFKVMTQSDHHEIASLTLEPTVQEFGMAYRGPARVVWVDDSSRVSFHVPEGDFTINLKAYTDRQ
jgi:hypothetical protein